MKLWPLLLIGSAAAQPATPVCWPLLSNTDYKGTMIVYGEGDTCRWAYWYCLPKDAKNPPLRVTFAGPKASNPDTTVIGRVLDAERRPDTAKPTVYSLMWKTYVKTDIDPVCKAEIAKVNQ